MNRSVPRIAGALRLVPVLLWTLACGGERPPAEPHLGPLHSELWGRAGERWDPAGRLPDFSWAGYHAGEDPLPEVPVATNVRDFGALGDGVADDSEAFLDAIGATEEGAILVPEGRYRITRMLRLENSGVVLRGAHRDRTVLYFPQPLYEALGEGRDGGAHGWSRGGGWIRVGAADERPDSLANRRAEGERLTTVAEPALRGETSLMVASTQGLEPGRMVRLIQSERGGTLSGHLHADHALRGRCTVDRLGDRRVDWAVRVTQVRGRRVFFDRPLRVDVRPEWRPEIHSFEPAIEEVGIERLTIEFPRTPYPGHYEELGYNAISLAGATNSWVRDVVIVNFDSAILGWYSRYCTIEGVLLSGRAGHYGIHLGGTQDCLATRFRYENTSLHDLSFSNLGNGSVYAWGKGVNLNLDLDSGAPYENLFTDLDVGEGWKRRRLWNCGCTTLGHCTAARVTLWNIRPRISSRFLPTWPQLNLIGPIRVVEDRPLRGLDAWFEDIHDVRPRNLWAAQRARRLGVPIPAREPLPRP